jgi:predicted aminopeptidase
MSSVRFLRAAVLAIAACLTSGCATVGYYAQSVSGHLSMMRAARPVDAWLDDPATPDALRERLVLSRRIRDYASQELKLPDNQSYRRYAELNRSAAVWNVVGAPELSLTLKTWCFPVVGCVGYRGYFDRSAAEEMAAQLRAEGYETAVYPVPAYSTLGALNWLGGDPLLSTFIRYPEGELARLLFHELSHQVAYAPGDTTFNESFATAVERIGGERWLAQSSEQARSDYQRLDGRRRDFRAVTQRAREALDALYRSPVSEDGKRRRKAEIIAALRAEHAALKAGPWEGFSGYDAWFERANNASLGVLGAYNELVPGFERLYEREGRDFGRFYAEVKRLAGLSKEERRATLAR